MAAEPVCKHFGTCGGCALQHLERVAMLEGKRRAVIDAFARRRIKVDPEPIIESDLHSRRRVVFSAERVDGDIRLGLMERRSHSLIQVEECPILVPEIVAALGDLVALAKLAASSRETLKIAVTACDNGLDVQLIDTETINDGLRRKLSVAAMESSILRLSVDDEILLQKAEPSVQFGDAAITPPPGGFLQAVKSCEIAMAELVVGHLQKSKRIADLYCGSGAFALRLAFFAQVHAADADAAVLTALSKATGASGMKPVTTEKRNLFERPLLTTELDKFDGVVLDPPRAGAETQCKNLAASSVRRVAYVSCNPETLARDAAILTANGYALQSVTPVDQFLYSTHVEAVALFWKQPAKKARPIFG